MKREIYDEIEWTRRINVERWERTERITDTIRRWQAHERHVPDLLQHLGLLARRPQAERPSRPKKGGGR